MPHLKPNSHNFSPYRHLTHNFAAFFKKKIIFAKIKTLTDFIDMKRVVITGQGIISPIGNSVAEFEESIKSGKLGITKYEHPRWKYSIHVAGLVKGFDPTAYGLSKSEERHNDLFSQFAIAAAVEAMNSSGIVSGENIEPERFAVYVGSGIGGMNTFIEQSEILFTQGPGRISPLFIPMMIPNIGGGNIAIKYNAQGPCLTHVSACATGTNSIGEAYLAIKYGRADAILAGGADAVVTPLAIGGFTNCKALTLESDPEKACIPFDIRR